MDWMDLVVQDVAELDYNSPVDQPSVMLVKADELRVILAARSPLIADERLHTFLNAAAGEGLVLDGVDAADIYVELFPERYAAAVASIEA